MGFEKGHKGFKPKGATHEKSKQWEQLGESITTKHTERFNSILSDCDDETFVKHYSAILEYFKPKLGRVEHTGKDGEEINQITRIEIIHTNASKSGT